MATSFGRYDHYQANAIQYLKKGWLHLLLQMSSCMESHLHQCQYLSAALNLLSMM
jgi:hypothetical protein